MIFRLLPMIFLEFVLNISCFDVVFAKEIEVFPNGTKFQEIVNLNDRTDAWATCYVMDRFLAGQGSADEIHSQEREKLAEATKLIIMITLLDDTNILRDNNRNALPVVWAANEIVLKRNIEYFELMIQVQDELGTEQFAKNFNRTRRVCESNALSGKQVLKEFEERIHSQDKKAMILVETLKDMNS